MARTFDELIKTQLGELMWQVLLLIQQNEALREQAAPAPGASPAEPKVE